LGESVFDTCVIEVCALYLAAATVICSKAWRPLKALRRQVR